MQSSVTTRALLFPLLLIGVLLSGFSGIKLGGNIIPHDVVFSLLAAVWIVLAVVPRNVVVHKSVIASLMLLFMALAITAVSGYSRTGLSDDLLTFVKVCAAFYLVPYLVADTVRRDRDVKILAGVFVLSASINTIVGIVDTLKLTDFETWLNVVTSSPEAHTARLHGLTGNPNHMGQQCAIAVFLSLGIVPQSRSVRRYAVWAAGFALALVGTIGSGSRGAFVAIVTVAVIVMLFRRHMGTGLKGSFSGLMFVGICGSAYAYVAGKLGWRGAVERFAEMGISDISTTTRMSAYADALSGFTHNPGTGVGIGHIGHVENIVLQFMQGAGVVGVLSLALYFLPTLRRAIKRLRRRHCDELLLAAFAGVLVYLVVTLSQNLVFARFSLIPMGLLWYLTSGQRWVSHTER